MTIDDSANHLERQALSRRIHCEHLSGLYVIFILAELDVLARLKLSPMKEAHSSRQQHDVSFLDAPVEKGLAGPGCLDHAAPVLEHRLKNSQTATSGDDPLRDHLADDRSIHAWLQRGNGTDRAGVFVAVGNVKQEIASGDDSQSPQRFRAYGPHTLEIVDGHVEVDFPAADYRC